MLVHVTLDAGLQNDQPEKRRTYERIVQLSGMKAINEKRFERYCIMSGEIDPLFELARLQKLPGVVSVEHDRQNQVQTDRS